MSLADTTYIALTTYRSSGERVTTPVWVVPLDDGRIGFWTAVSTGKVSRLTDDPRVVVQPCDARGRVTGGSAPVSGSATIVRSGRAFGEVEGKVRTKYGARVRLSGLLARVRLRDPDPWTYADTVVLISLDDPSGAQANND